MTLVVETATVNQILPPRIEARHGGVRLTEWLAVWARMPVTWAALVMRHRHHFDGAIPFAVDHAEGEPPKNIAASLALKDWLDLWRL